MSQKVDSVVRRLCKSLAASEPKSAVILYGSHARGDANPNSDIDILLVSDDCFDRSRGDNVCISRYPERMLTDIAREGALFVLHLKKEGVVFSDPFNSFSRTVAHYVPPPSYAALNADLSLLARALDVSANQYLRSPAWLNRVGFYVMRSLLFARFAEQQAPLFSIECISREMRDSRPLRIYQRKYQKHIAYSEFCELRRYIEELLQIEIRNDAGSLVEYLVRCSGQSRLVDAFARRLCELSDEPDLAMLAASYALKSVRTRE